MLKKMNSGKVNIISQAKLVGVPISLSDRVIKCTVITWNKITIQANKKENEETIKRSSVSPDLCESWRPQCCCGAWPG